MNLRNVSARLVFGSALFFGLLAAVSSDTFGETPDCASEATGGTVAQIVAENPPQDLLNAAYAGVERSLRQKAYSRLDSCDSYADKFSAAALAKWPRASGSRNDEERHIYLDNTGFDLKICQSVHELYGPKAADECMQMGQSSGRSAAGTRSLM